MKKKVVGRPFKKGKDASRHQLTCEERSRGYRAALEYGLNDWAKFAWLSRRVKKHCKVARSKKPPA